MNTGGIIVCGGQSQRMGLAKASLPFGEEVMLARVVRLLSEVVQPIVVVAAPDQTLPQLDAAVEVVRDRCSGRGPLEGLYVGLQSLEGRVESAYVTGCDVPLLKPDFVRAMIAALEEHEIAVPRDDRYYHPLAAVYRTRITALISQLLDQNQLRPFFLFEKSDTREVDVQQLREVDSNLLTLENLNEPDDYFRALECAGYKAPEELAKALRRE